MAQRRHYGWNPSRKDINDFFYSAPRSTLVALPSKVNLLKDSDIDYLPLNQGALGSCGPHSITADLLFAALKQDGIKKVPLPSRLFIYYWTRALQNTVNSDSGVENRTMLKALAKYGWCDEGLCQYTIADYRKAPGTAANEQGLARKIESYLAVRQNLDDMKGCLAGGDGFIAGFSVYQSFESDLVERTGRVPLPRRGEKQLGGHDVWVYGYDDDAEEFLFLNSYGKQWGDEGKGFLPYAYLTNQTLSGDFWTVRHSALPLPPIDPIPTPPAPTPAPGEKVVEFAGTDIAKVKVVLKG